MSVPVLSNQDLFELFESVGWAERAIHIDVDAELRDEIEELRAERDELQQELDAANALVEGLLADRDDRDNQIDNLKAQLKQPA